MKKILLTLLSAFILLMPLSALSGSDDQAAARAALARGEIMPLKDMLSVLERVLPGNNVIRVKFERDDGRYIYEFKVIDAKGVIREVELDAKTGDVLEIEVDD